MTCPRDKREMYIDSHSPETYRCETCGNMITPAYQGNVADDSGSGARRHRTQGEKLYDRRVIRALVEDGYTNPQIMELTGYSRSLVGNEARGMRSPITHPHKGDN